MEACRQCRWFAENTNPKVIGKGYCQVRLPPMLERMPDLRTSALNEADIERGCGMWRSE